MAELATVARPYAEATFNASLEKGRLAPVAESLALLAAISRDETMRSVLWNPKVSAQPKKEISSAAAGARLAEIAKSLVSLLVENHREVLMGDISQQFDELKN